MLKMRWTPVSVFCFLLLHVQTEAEESEDRVKWGSNEYIQYYRGSPDSRLILTVSHGGYLKPIDLPNRKDGCYDVNGNTCIWSYNCGMTDAQQCQAIIAPFGHNDNTQELALRLRKKLALYNGKMPHLIINRLTRTKLDANREINEAALGDKDAEQVWWDYNCFIQKAKESINGAGLLLDIHGQSHPEKWIELGYTITGAALDANSFTPEESSIRSLAGHLRRSRNIDFESLLRGSASLGAMFQHRGHKTIPSPQHPTTNGGGYFYGYYTVNTHGSRFGGAIDAIDFYSPGDARKETVMEGYLTDAVVAISEFMKYYDQIRLSPEDRPHSGYGFCRNWGPDWKDDRDEWKDDDWEDDCRRRRPYSKAPRTYPGGLAWSFAVMLFFYFQRAYLNQI